MPCRRWLIALLGLMFLLAGCLRWPGPASSPRTVALYGGQGGYELVHPPALARVELYRLAENPAQASAGAPRIGGIPIASGPETLEDAALKRISEILRDNASFDWSNPPDASAPARPGVALRFAGVKKTIDLLLTFADNTLAVYEGDAPVGRARIGPRGSELSDLLAPSGRRKAAGRLYE